MVTDDFDLGLMVTALSQTESWYKALDEATRVCRRWIIVVDFCIEPVPEWAQDLPRQPVPRSELIAAMSDRGFSLVDSAGCGPMDGELFVKTPRWTWPVVAAITAGYDLLLSRLLPPETSDYQALLFRN